MFAIYDIQGLRFRDTLEHLQKVREVQASQSAWMRPEDREQALHHLGQQASGHSLAATPVSVKARQAYREMLQISEREAILHAHQLMSSPVVSVQLTLDIVSAWEQMRDRHYHQLPVLDERQRIVGLVSQLDLLRLLLIDDGEVSYVRGRAVKDVMSGEVITADPVTDVRRIARVMVAYHLNAVPIVNERDALTGLVSRSDILRSVANDPPLSLWS